MIELLGRWKLVQADPDLGLDPGAVAHFKPDGELVYLVPERDRTVAIRLTYRVDGAFLVTDQPSSPREERTRFRLDGDVLSLTYDSGVARFRRERSDSVNRAS